MSPNLKSAAARTATAIAVVALSAAGLAGTAQAATPTGAQPAAATTALAAPPPPRRFHQRFRTQAQCIAFANHDHNPRTHGWDRRRGADRNQPWEYWY